MPPYILHAHLAVEQRGAVRRNAEVPVGRNLPTLRCAAAPDQRSKSKRLAQHQVSVHRLIDNGQAIRAETRIKAGRTSRKTSHFRQFPISNICSGMVQFMHAPHLTPVKPSVNENEADCMEDKRVLSEINGRDVREMPDVFTILDEAIPSLARVQTAETVELPDIQTMSGYIRAHYEEEIIAELLRKIRRSALGQCRG